MHTKDERDGALAVGYIMGVREMTYQKDHCASIEVKPLESAIAVKTTLEAMPQHRDLIASLVVIEALEARWPCRDEGKSKTSKSCTRETHGFAWVSMLFE